MPVTNQPEGQRTARPRRRLPVITWIGVIGTSLLALLGLASGGVWSMLLMIALVVLPTALYGMVFRRSTWLRLPRKRAFAAISTGVALVALIGSTSAYGATHPVPETPVHVATAAPTGTPKTAKESPTPRAATTRPRATPTPTPTTVVTTKEVVETTRIPFGSTTVQSATLAQGTSSITTAGVRGVDTKTYTVTYTDGVETDRALKSDVVTTPPVAQVTTVGTYVAPAAPAPAPAPAAPTCTNGTYVNSAGATVCRPEVSSSAPAGATAKCGDGTYSFSQSRRGTCSSHGGVAAWL